MNEPYDPQLHGPDVEMATALAPGEPDDRDEGSEDEVRPRRGSSLASGLGALVRPSREARFGLAALLSFLILVTVLIMKREKPKAPAQGKGGRAIPVAKIDVRGPDPSALALSTVASPASREPLAPTDESPPVPPPAAEAEATRPAPVPAPSEAVEVPARVDPVQLAGADQVGVAEEGPELPPPVGVEPSGKPGAVAKAVPSPQPPPPAAPAPAPSPAPATDSSPSPSPDVSEPRLPAATDASSPEAAPPTPDSGAPIDPTPLPPPAPDSAAALREMDELPNSAESSAPQPSDPPAPTILPSPATPAGPPAPPSATPSPEPLVNDLAPNTPRPVLPVPVETPATPSPSPSETQESSKAPSVAPEEAPAAPGEAPSAPGEAPAKEVPNLVTPPQDDPSASKPDEGPAQGSLVTIPNAGKRGLFAEDLERPDRPADTTVESPKVPDLDAVGQVEPVPHVVQRGENFWTISRLYYNSGRFYKALWAANQHLVPAPDQLYVGTTIMIPAPEALDRSLILPPKTTRPSSPAGPSSARASTPVRRASQSALAEVPAEPKEVEVHLPAAPPSRRGSTPSDEVDPNPEVGTPPRLPVYKVRPHETLRSIAKRTLGDSHREDEIYELNRAVIDDPYQLTVGQEIKLPEDARVGRRAR